MTSFDLIVVGLGSAGMTAAQAAPRFGLRTAGVERARVGGDCLWTGCVPSKALIASARLAHRMRTADRLGLEPVDAPVDTARVWARVRAVQEDIAATSDSPQRFREAGSRWWRALRRGWRSAGTDPGAPRARNRPRPWRSAAERSRPGMCSSARAAARPPRR